MKYLVAGLIIGGFIGQNIAYTVSYYKPRTVEVPVVGECQMPEQVVRMQMLVDRMPLTIREQFDPAPVQRDQIAELIMGDVR